MPNTKPKLHISVITLFSDIFTNHLQHLPISRALEKGLVQIDFINLRDFAVDKRGTVDSPPYGGGPGMILRPEPIYNAITFALNKSQLIVGGYVNAKIQIASPPTADRNDLTTQNGERIVFLTPRGKTYNQNKASEFSQVDHLVIVCGRYEGVDQRVIDYFKDACSLKSRAPKLQKIDPTTKSDSVLKQITVEEISIGNYVLSGGEVAAMAIVESVVRLLPEAIDNPEALINESFNPSRPDQVEHPQYSRPEEWQGLKVPEVLISGNHAKIDKWKGIASPPTADRNNPVSLQ